MTWERRSREHPHFASDDSDHTIVQVGHTEVRGAHATEQLQGSAQSEQDPRQNEALTAASVYLLNALRAGALLRESKRVRTGTTATREQGELTCAAKAPASTKGVRLMNEDRCTGFTLCVFEKAEHTESESTGTDADRGTHCGMKSETE